MEVKYPARIEFGNDHEKQTLGIAKTPQGAAQMWMNHLDEIGFKTYYQRCWMVGETLKIDFGSHSQFVYITPTSELERNPIMEQNTYPMNAFRCAFQGIHPFMKALENVVIRTYDDDGYAQYKMVVGYTALAHDTILHIIDVEGAETLEEAVKGFGSGYRGIDLVSLNALLKDPDSYISVVPQDQFSDTPTMKKYQADKAEEAARKAKQEEEARLANQRRYQAQIEADKAAAAKKRLEETEAEADRNARRAQMERILKEGHAKKAAKEAEAKAEMAATPTPVSDMISALLKESAKTNVAPKINTEPKKSTRVVLPDGLTIEGDYGGFAALVGKEVADTLFGKH